MMGTWKRIRTLALLVCGLGTAPFGSLEQLDAADGRNVTSPCLSGVGATPLPLHTAVRGAELPVRTVALPAEWALIASHTEGQQAAVVLPTASTRTVTYHANAPPFHLI